MSNAQPQWIALNLDEGIYLKAIPDEKTHFILVIEGLNSVHSDYQRVKSELGFHSVPESGLLFRRMPRNSIKPSFFQKVWPTAHATPLSTFSRDQYMVTPEQRNEIKALSDALREQAVARGVASPRFNVSLIRPTPPVAPARSASPSTSTAPSSAPRSRTKPPAQPTADAERGMATWIDLGDPDGVVLKAGKYKDRLTLVIEGVTPGSMLFDQVVRELNFVPSPEGRYLIKTHPKGKLAYPHEFHSVWPNAKLAKMNKKDFAINFSERAKRLERQQRKAELADQNQTQEQASHAESLHEVLTHSQYLGRNLNGDRVFLGAVGRFYVSNADDMTLESESNNPTLFLRSRTASELKDCAKGLIIACSKGESYRLKELNEFASVVLDIPVDELTDDDKLLVSEAIHDATVEFLLEDMDELAYLSSDATYLYEMMPGLASFQPDSADLPFLPTPIALHIQRYLAPASQVHMYGNVSSLNFSLLPENTNVYLGDTLIPKWKNKQYVLPNIEPLSNQDSPSDATYLHLDEHLHPDDLYSAMNALNDDGLAVVTATTPDAQAQLAQYGHVIQSVVVPSFLTHTSAIELHLVKRGQAPEQQNTPKVTIQSWENLKTIVDETLRRMGHAIVNRPSSKPNPRTDNRYQRPYTAFSTVGPSSTMVPQNLQSAVASALVQLQEQFGPVDDFVSSELGISVEKLAERFSPEQVDAVALIMSRMIAERGFILGDETGLGKGRTIAAAATWANRNKKKVIFVTDRSNLFSDLARDLIDINEWERFRPLITNTDGEIIHMFGEGESLAKPLTAAQFQRVVRDGHNANLIFTTYSQMNQLNSTKSNWLIEQAKDAVLILDESHIAAGENSNITQNVSAMVQASSSTLYSSATWTKTLKNLSIYSKALPENINYTQISDAFENEGESFSEVFSTMLAMDGAFVRREHDLSKIDFVLDSADKYTERNIAVTDAVAEVLGMMAMLSGEINQALHRMNAETRRNLMNAKEAHSTIQSAARRDQVQFENLQGKQQHLEREINEIQLWLEDAESNGLQDNTRLEVERENLDRLERELARVNEQLAQLLGDEGEAAIATARQSPSNQLFSSSFGTGGAIYQVMRRTQAALLTDYVADRVIEGLEKGQRPVVVFSETGENFVNQFIEQEYKRLTQLVESVRNRLAEGDQVSAEDIEESEKVAELLGSGGRPTDLVKHIQVPTLQDMMRGLLVRLGGVTVSNLDLEIDPNSPQPTSTHQAEAEAQENDASEPTESVEGDNIDAPGEENDSNRNMPRFIERTTLVSTTQLTNITGISTETVNQFMQGIEEINKKIETLPKIPIIPIDALRMRLQKEGISLGEISGRQYQLDPVDPDAPSIVDTPVRVTRRSRKKIDTILNTKRFNDGELDVIAINESGATGLSVHASPRFGNSNQRLILEWQPSADPTKRSQLFGRGNRFDQVVPPEIGILTSNVPSENRSIMMNNKKFANMSATIRSSRENAVINETIPDMMNRTGDRVVQEYLLDNPGIASRIDIPNERLEVVYGLANLVFQRLSLLPSNQYIKVFDDLMAAYEDALIENEISLESNEIETKDWRARTISEELLWGPSENLEGISAFESPVYLRTLEFESHYKPLRWDDVHKKIMASTERLAKDDRVSPLPVVPFVAGRRWDNFTTTETLSQEEHQQRWENRLIRQLATLVDKDHVKHVSRSAGLNQQLLDLDIEFTSFSSISGRCLPIHTRAQMDSNQNQLMMILISNSGKRAKLWCPDGQGGADVYLMNLDAVLANQAADTQTPAKVFYPQPRIESLSDAPWVKQRFNELWQSNDPDIVRLQMKSAIDRASLVLEAKKITALNSTGAESIEDAISLPDHNAVKEAHWRKLFMESVISKLRPGVSFNLVDAGDRHNPIASFYGSRSMLIVDVTLPAKNEEAVLSKWKFHVLTPGSEKVSVLSGAMLYKSSGIQNVGRVLSDVPSTDSVSRLFPLIVQIKDLLSPLENSLKEETVRLFNRHQEQLTRITKEVLVGNTFQANQWARATKSGQAIIYTDEQGSPHRAVEILNPNAPANQRAFDQPSIDVNRFPKQINKIEMITALFDKLFDPNEPVKPNLSTTSIYAYRFASTFNAGMTDDPQKDVIIVSPTRNQISIMMRRTDRERFRRTLLQAVREDKKEWALNHPGEPDPLHVQTRAQRTSEAHGFLTISIPEEKQARHRLLRALVKSNGFTLYVPRSPNDQRNQGVEATEHTTMSLYDAACAVEREYYDDYVQQIQQTKQRLKEKHAKRQQHQTMIDQAVGQLTLDSVSETSPNITSTAATPPAITESAPEPIEDTLDLTGFPPPMTLDMDLNEESPNSILSQSTTPQF